MPSVVIGQRCEWCHMTSYHRCNTQHTCYWHKIKTNWTINNKKWSNRDGSEIEGFHRKWHLGKATSCRRRPHSWQHHTREGKRLGQPQSQDNTRETLLQPSSNPCQASCYCKKPGFFQWCLVLTPSLSCSVGSKGHNGAQWDRIRILSVGRKDMHVGYEVLTALVCGRKRLHITIRLSIINVVDPSAMTLRVRTIHMSPQLTYEVCAFTKRSFGNHY